MTGKFSFRYTDEMKAFAKACYAKMSIGDTVKAFNEKFGTDKSADSLRGALKSWGFKNGRGFGEIMKGVPKLFSDEQVEYLKVHYPKLSLPDLHVQFNAHFGTKFGKQQIFAFMKREGIKSGRTGHFEAGVPSWSSGTKGVIKANSGSFRKGSVPHNYVPVGSERINTDGYHDIKIADPNVWKAKHVILYEQHNGPVPEGAVVRFKDGDKNNLDLDNLILANRVEHVLMNTNKLAHQPEELRDSVVLISRIQAKRIQLTKSH